MATQQTVIQLGDPRLRQRALTISSHQWAAYQTLVDDLIATAVATDGVGIAAPQVAIGVRLLIVASRPNSRYPTAPTMAPTAMFNPRLLAHGDQQVKGWEGCLSVPGLRGQIRRYREIEVAYCDRNGLECQQVLTDFVARIFQHELDHLDGKLFVDRIESPADLMSEAEYQRLMGNSGVGI